MGPHSAMLWMGVVSPEEQERGLAKLSEMSFWGPDSRNPREAKLSSQKYSVGPSSSTSGMLDAHGCCSDCHKKPNLPISGKQGLAESTGSGVLSFRYPQPSGFSLLHLLAELPSCFQHPYLIGWGNGNAPSAAKDSSYCIFSYHHK